MWPKNGVFGQPTVALRSSVLVLVLGILAFAPVLVFAAGQPKIDMCHFDDEGAYHIITIADPAFDAHVAHGDYAVESEVPFNDIDDDCDPSTLDDACPALGLESAITRQIVSVTEPVTLTIEIVTITAQPYEPEVTSLEFPEGFDEVSLNTTSCSIDGANFRCRHEAVLQATTACEGDGDYTMTVEFNCADGISCPVCGTTADIDFSLDTEFFCAP